MQRSIMEIGHDGTAHVQLLQPVGADSQQKRPLLRMQHVPDVRHDHREHTELTDEESLDLAGELQETIFSEIIDRLQLPGQDHPLAAELLQTMELRERPH